MITRFLLFIVINFAGLALGSLFTSTGVASDWYQDLNQAPWTPPGWMFGAAWTTIMVCFAWYMAELWKKAANRNLLAGLFIAQWILNFAWNPVFFHFNWILFGLIIITALTALVWYMFVKYRQELKMKAWLLLPYGLWLLIATSLNAYILFQNPG